MVMLFTLLGDSIISVDTTLIQNGDFRFHGKEFVRDFSVITTGNFPDKVLSTEVILERGKINVHLDSISVVSGAFLQTSYKCYQDSNAFLTNVFDNQINRNNIKTLNELYINKEFRDVMNHALRVIKGNANNALGKRVFQQHNLQMTDEQLYSIYDLFEESTKSDIEIIYFINDRQRSLSEYWASHTVLNTVFQDFDLLSIDGTTKQISDYVGKSKFLFIDFWASWCGPCIADFPNIKDVYDMYHEKGLSVLGISFDTSETAWKKAVETHQIPWETVMAKSEKEIRDAYAISGIPYGILLYDNGIIVEVNLNGELLAVVIRKYLE